MAGLRQNEARITGAPEVSPGELLDANSILEDELLKTYYSALESIVDDSVRKYVFGLIDEKPRSIGKADISRLKILLFVELINRHVPCWNAETLKNLTVLDGAGLQRDLGLSIYRQTNTLCENFSRSELRGLVVNCLGKDFEVLVERGFDNKAALSPVSPLVKDFFERLSEVVYFPMVPVGSYRSADDFNFFVSEVRALCPKLSSELLGKAHKAFLSETPQSVSGFPEHVVVRVNESGDLELYAESLDLS